MTSRVDSEGNTVDEQGYRLDKDGKRFQEYELTVNGVSIGKYNKDTALETVLNDINSNTEAGVSVSFSKTTNQFVFTAKETGAGGRVEIGGELGERLFGKVNVTDKDHYTAGQDAKFTATINGQKMEFSRSSNTFDLDGMSITLNGTFEVKDGETPVTFSSKTTRTRSLTWSRPWWRTTTPLCPRSKRPTPTCLWRSRTAPGTSP